MIAAQALLVAALAWGALAFGAVYPWAYWPLAGALLVVSAVSLTTPTTLSWRDQRWPAAAALLFALAAIAQAVPLPLSLLPRISPASLDVLTQLDLAVATGAADRHALSVSPRSTLTAVALFGVFALTALGSARLISRRGPRGIAEAITALGVVLALVAIIQKSAQTQEIYGFWTPQLVAKPYGPFVNRNHFAGWMLMAIPVTLGLLCASVARGMESVKPTLRDRVIWLSTPAASRLVLLSGAAAVMTLSLVMTLSRAGIAALIVAVTATSIIAIRRQGTAGRKLATFAFLAVLVVAVFSWVGVDAIVKRFETNEINDRRGPWADARAIAAKFPIAGTGFNTYSVATLFYQEHDTEHHYAHAHNDYLQLAAEGGVLLIVPALLCVAALAWAVGARFRDERSVTSYWLRIGAVTGIAAIALQEMVDFSLQMPGNAALFAVLCGMAAHRAPARAYSKAPHGTLPEVQIRTYPSLAR